MIGYLSGNLIDHSNGKWLVVVNAPSAHGASLKYGAIGYTVTVPQKPRYLELTTPCFVELFIHTHVREDVLELYGFFSKAEKELFLTLLTVNGIGPKGALSILSHVEPKQLIQAILEGDKEALLEVQGVGKKTAERIVLELRDPLKKKIENPVWREIWKDLHTIRDTSLAFPMIQSEGGSVRSLIRDAKAALLGLGYREPEVTHALDRLLAEDSPPQRVEELIRSALQSLGSGHCRNEAGVWPKN